MKTFAEATSKRQDKFSADRTWYDVTVKASKKPTRKAKPKSEPALNEEAIRHSERLRCIKFIQRMAEKCGQNYIKADDLLFAAEALKSLPTFPRRK